MRLLQPFQPTNRNGNPNPDPFLRSSSPQPSSREEGERDPSPNFRNPIPHPLSPIERSGQRRKEGESVPDPCSTRSISLNSGVGPQYQAYKNSWATANIASTPLAVYRRSTRGGFGLVFWLALNKKI